jgi:hypothetical protein
MYKWQPETADKYYVVSFILLFFFKTKNDRHEKKKKKKGNYRTRKIEETGHGGWMRECVSASGGGPGLFSSF